MRALVRGCLLMTTSARAAAAAAEDVFGDGSVLKRIVHLGAGGPLPLRGEVVGCAYVGRLASGFVFERFDASSPFVFAVGEARIVSGLDRAVATMAVGEIADVEVRFDAGYGEAGLSGKGVPPRAALFFNGLEVLSLSAPRTADGEAALYLSEPRAENAAADENRRTLHVDGEAVQLDYLGPMVVGKDGTVARITNWPEMTEAERERTLRIITKRNRQRLADLKVQMAPDF
ncbi:hypothetical protein M885DRAFT_547085 [Pelagophyceae sp. CCMP2097]|nr:hypothetical protein M885DRAFT_547085 [Pelagophyceae sp. CCMP2097]